MRMPFDHLLRELDEHKQKTLAMGGPKKFAQRKAQGALEQVSPDLLTS